MDYLVRPSKTRRGSEYSPYNPPAVFEAIRLPNYDIARVISNHIPNEAVELTDLRAPEPLTAIPPEPLSHPPAQPSVQPSSSSLNKPSPNAGVYRRRAEKRLQAKQSQGFAHRRDTVMPQLLETAAVHKTPVNVADFPVDSSGWIAVNEPVGMQRAADRQQQRLQGQCKSIWTPASVFINGTAEIPASWLMSMAMFSLISSADPTIWVIWQRPSAPDLMAEKSAGVVWTAKETDAHRGVNSINEGWFWSKEQCRLFWLCGGQKGIAAELRNDPDMKRIASFVSSAYAYWFPELYSTATARITKLLKELQSQVRTFPMSAFTCVAFNFGPQVSTTLHRDWTDMAGGHVCSGSARLLVEFPPGSLILFPSALISHANIPVRPGETRSSIVQYTPGAVCRFVENDFRTEKQIQELNPAEYDSVLAAKSTRWATAVQRLPTLAQLGVYTA
ncbi:hypothetical protein MSAN_02332400 [Mycena sanguinolenta]|uniref:Uncharacterized protein n=1 Tax=Mycena sanguinolenta TaxID=230812 RepID=A0A8H7CFL0_9AGAR|nr:hypothetical protein MSAN_02332400 [Mycena sanguinolenta]